MFLRNVDTMYKTTRRHISENKNLEYIITILPMNTSLLFSFVSNMQYISQMHFRATFRDEQWTYVEIVTEQNTKKKKKYQI